MLVDNRFIYLSLPRCASTSFYITCLKNNIDIHHYSEDLVGKSNTNLDLTLDNETIADNIVHAHEKITNLKLKFGNDYDVISVKRNRHERFISLWKHVIDLISLRFPKHVFDIFKNIKVDDLLAYTQNDLLSDTTKVQVLDTFFKNNGLVEYNDWYMKTIIYILINPTSYWHNNDPNIIWFDFDKMNELEEWVSDKLGKSFKLEKSNGSQHFDCNIQLNEKFIDIYDSIYNFYDLPKQVKTLI
jgi:hypothetical protein